MNRSMLLWGLILAPVFYYIGLIGGSLLWPGYSHATQYASELGSAASPHPMFFNVNAMLCGLAAFVGGFGLTFAITQLKGEDTVSFVDLGSGKELGRSPTGKMPHEIAVSPDGKQAAVVAYGDKTIDLFDVATRAKLKTIDLSPNEGPHGIAWLIDGRIVVTTERSQSIAVVDPVAGKLLSSIKTDQQGTHMVAVTSDGTTAYTANIPAGTVTVVDIAKGKKLRDVAVGGRPQGIALSRDELVLWVGDLE